MKTRNAIALLSVAPFAAFAADCDLQAGKQAFDNKCGICHAANAGASHTVGPNLHGIVSRPIGRAEGFVYSEALARVDGVWTEQRLNDFLAAPQKNIPGTAMPFQGLKTEPERRRLICFLEAQR